MHVFVFVVANFIWLLARLGHTVHKVFLAVSWLHPSSV